MRVKDDLGGSRGELHLHVWRHVKDNLGGRGGGLRLRGQGALDLSALEQDTKRLDEARCAHVHLSIKVEGQVHHTVASVLKFELLSASKCTRVRSNSFVPSVVTGPLWVVDWLAV